MSAFICGESDFKAVAAFAIRRRYGRDRQVDPRYVQGIEPPENPRDDSELASLYANALYQENVRSVSHRYPGDPDNLPGPISRPTRLEVTSADLRTARHLEPVQILKCLDCIEYQSCETGDYESTTAYRLLHAIRKAAIRSLPGYEQASWGLK